MRKRWRPSRVILVLSLLLVVWIILNLNGPLKPGSIRPLDLRRNSDMASTSTNAGQNSALPSPGVVRSQFPVALRLPPSQKVLAGEVLRVTVESVYEDDSRSSPPPPGIVHCRWRSEPEGLITVRPDAIRSSEASLRFAAVGTVSCGELIVDISSADGHTHTERTQIKILPVDPRVALTRVAPVSPDTHPAFDPRGQLHATGERSGARRTFDPFGQGSLERFYFTVKYEREFIYGHQTPRGWQARSFGRLNLGRYVLLADHKGLAHVFFQAADPKSSGLLQISSCALRDHGLKPSLVGEGVCYFYPQEKHFAIDQTGGIHAVLHDWQDNPLQSGSPRNPMTGGMKYCRSRGKQPQTVVQATGEPAKRDVCNAAIALDGQGQPLIVYAFMPVKGMWRQKLQLARLSGEDWIIEDLPAADPQCDAGGPLWLAVDSNDKPWIAWLDQSSKLNVTYLSDNGWQVDMGAHSVKRLRSQVQNFWLDGSDRPCFLDSEVHGGRESSLSLLRRGAQAWERIVVSPCGQNHAGVAVVESGTGSRIGFVRSAVDVSDDSAIWIAEVL